MIVHTTLASRIACVFTGIACMFASAGWAQDAQGSRRVADEVLASSVWKEYAELLAENYLGTIDIPSLELHCRKSIPRDAQSPDAGAVDDCLRGAADSLDYLTTYLSTSEVAQLDAQAKRGFVGIGIEITQRDGFVLIVTPIAGGAAERAGLKPGDLILSLDGRPTQGLPLADAVRLMRGEVGTPLNLVVIRPGVPTSLAFAVKREAIRLLSVRSKWVSPNVAYIRVSQFRDETYNELIAAVQKLQADGAGSVNNLVLDLRLCPGGLLAATADVGSLFIPAGEPVLRTAGRKADTNRSYAASADPGGIRRVGLAAEPRGWPLRGTRLVVLVDRHTGGGAEALAALLKEVRGASIVGETSSGFGIVQQLFRLSSGAAVRIGTSLMATPGGRVWNGTGIEPDVRVEREQGAKWELGDLQVDGGLKAAIAALRK